MCSSLLVGLDFGVILKKHLVYGPFSLLEALFPALALIVAEDMTCVARG